MFKWLFHILIFATNDGSDKYQKKRKTTKTCLTVSLLLSHWYPRSCVRPPSGGDCAPLIHENNALISPSLCK